MPSDLSTTYDWMTVVAGLMAVVWLFRYKSKGRRAIVMCIAFLDFGALVQIRKFDAQLIYQALLAVVLLTLLGLDMALRSAKSQEDRK